MNIFFLCAQKLFIVTAETRAETGGLGTGIGYPLHLLLPGCVF